MKTVTFLLFTFAFLLFSACRPAAAPVSVSNRAVSINDRPVTNVPLPPSKPLREMSWTTLDGIVGKLGDHEGKAVILDFWATFCGPCREGIPHLNALLAKHGADSLVIIGLNVGGYEDLVEVPEFIKTTKIDYPIAVPEDALNRFIFAESSSIPQTAVFDRKGLLVQKLVGYNSEIGEKLDRAVEVAVSR